MTGLIIARYLWTPAALCLAHTVPNVRRPRPILIVVGAHLTAETQHRPIAYALRERFLSRIAADPEGVVVCSDLWYLNQRELRGMPTVSIGGPDVNALTAYLGSRLPSSLVVDDRLIVQMDLEADAPVAACWGTDAQTTNAAVEAFGERYLDRFLAVA